MNNRRDRERLLNDLLADADQVGLRGRLLAQTLSGARRRRFIRQARRAGAVVAIMVSLAFLAWRWNLPMVPSQDGREMPYAMVRTQRLPDHALVRTQPLAGPSVVASAPSPDLLVLATRSGQHSYTDVDDDKLLALAAPRVTILVRLEPHSAELIIVPESGSGQRPNPE